MSTKFRYGTLNTILFPGVSMEIPTGDFGDDNAMWEYHKHAIRKQFEADVTQGTGPYKAIVLTTSEAVESDPGILDSLGKKFEFIPRPVFRFMARPAEYVAGIPDPCESIPSIAQGMVPNLTEAEKEAVKFSIACHPVFTAKAIGGTGYTQLEIPNIGDIVEIEFEKGPDGGRLFKGTYIRLVRKSGYQGMVDTCEKGPAEYNDLFALEGGYVGTDPSEVGDPMPECDDVTNPCGSVKDRYEGGDAALEDPANWLHPTKGVGTLGSPYGMRIHPIEKVQKFHAGIDISAARDTPIYAPMDGIITKQAQSSGAGQYIEIDHGTYNGFTYSSRHLHLNRFKLQPGSSVTRGQHIGYMGSTGGSTGPHLHYEIKRDNANRVGYGASGVDPEPYSYTNGAPNS